MAVWDIAGDGSLSRNYKSIAAPDGGALPFSFSPIPDTDAYIAVDPNVGYDILDLSDAAHNVAVPIQGQVANCWIDRSAKTGNYYLVDAGLSVLNEIQVDSNLKGSFVNVCLPILCHD